MSRDGQQSICQMLGYPGDGVIPATRGQILPAGALGSVLRKFSLFNVLGKCICSPVCKKHGVAAKTGLWVSLHVNYTSLLIFTLKEKT